MATQIYLIRHGETAWSLTGQHTARTDLPLTLAGEQTAARLTTRLEAVNVAYVFTSSLECARRICELAGLGGAARLEPDLQEWDYGAYEGRASAEIRAQQPDWDVFRGGCPQGESIDQVTPPTDRSEVHGRRGLFVAMGAEPVGVVGLLHTMDEFPPLLAPHMNPSPPLSTEDKAMIICSHLSALLGVGFLLPLIVYLIKKQDGGPVAAHAKEALNFHLSLLLYSLCAIPLLFVGIGFLVFGFIIFGTFVLSIVAAVKAADGALYRYPLCIRFI